MKGSAGDAATEQLHISFCQVAAAVVEENGVKTEVNAVVIQPGKLDRSPTGTGCLAPMAVLHAQGKLRHGDQFIGRSIVVSECSCRLEAVTEVVGRLAIIPTITGRAWITGTRQDMLDPADPWPEGYRLSDTWPKLHGA